MLKEFKEMLEKRRTHYGLSKEKVASDEEIQDMIEHVVKYTPSAFNSQTARVVLLLGDNHTKLWNITMEALRKIVPADKFAPTEEKINSFDAGYGTVLFFEDTDVVKNLEESFPTYAHNFSSWSKEASGMHQYNVWMGLKLLGYGASLQHYNELIEEEVKKEWNIPANWQMRAQMPFGKATDEPGEKTFQPIEERVKVFK